MAFFIPAYQRGYRWGEDEVRALFDDIDEFLKKGEGGFYCLQPLIVRKRDSFEARKSLESIVSGGEDETQSGKTPEFVYELIDGQQRLTTVWLLLFALAGGKPPYRIYYEIPRNVDEDFILSAKGLLERKCAELDGEARLGLQKAIERKVVFLLYEVVEKGEKSSEKVFRQINKGKIELTNAELFKALLLDDELAKTEQERREQELIAFEWDKIEQSLRNDSFWFFISNDKSDERTRIDYILDIYADTLNDDKKLDPEKGRYSFLAVQAHLRSKGDYSFADIKEIWEKIVFIHDKLRSYYSNPAIYHLLGFLVAVSGKSRRQAEEMVFYVYLNCREQGEADTEKFLKSEGRSLSVEAVYNYLNWLEKAFVIYRCQRYDLQGKSVLKTQEKFYLADASLKYCIMGFNPKSIAAMLENIVYFELRRRGYEVYIGKNETKEIDFMAVQRDERIYVQVCRRLPEESDREVANLLEIKDHYPKYVVTLDELAAGNINGVKIVHLADFLLSDTY